MSRHNENKITKLYEIVQHLEDSKDATISVLRTEEFFNDILLLKVNYEKEKNSIVKLMKVFLPLEEKVEELGITINYSNETRIQFDIEKLPPDYKISSYGNYTKYRNYENIYSKDNVVDFIKNIDSRNFKLIKEFNSDAFLLSYTGNYNNCPDIRFRFTILETSKWIFQDDRQLYKVKVLMTTPFYDEIEEEFTNTNDIIDTMIDDWFKSIGNLFEHNEKLKTYF